MSAPPPLPNPPTPPHPPPTPTTSPPVKPPPPPPKELTGFRSALQHTGIPHSVLTWKPRLPSRNWTIFLTAVSTVTYLYYDDRRQCRKIREETIRQVEHLSKEPLKTNLELPRKVTVIGAKWPEDEDTDRACRYFRKYVKPYLVAAAVDYEQMTAPQHGSIARQIHAQVLTKRRQSLGLEATPVPKSLPEAIDPAGVAQRELEGGTVIVGRATLKEYLEGLRRGWSGGVGEWVWEKEVERRLKGDGVFEGPEPEPEPELMTDLLQDPTQASLAAVPAAFHSSLSSLGLFSRPLRSSSTQPSSSPLDPSGTPSIPDHFHLAPTQLPPQPPLLLVPFTNHVGFRQIPQMIYDFFTERHRVQIGAEAALKLIFAQTRDFQSPSSFSAAAGTGVDTDFDTPSEQSYKKAFQDLPDRTAKARKDYYDQLEPKIQTARECVRGEREMSAGEAKSGSVISEEDLKAERLKKEMRWMGTEDGFEVVRAEKGVVWDERWEGWLKVFEKPGSVQSGSFA